jgi:hypothetical protein
MQWPAAEGTKSFSKKVKQIASYFRIAYPTSVVVKIYVSSSTSDDILIKIA